MRRFDYRVPRFPVRLPVRLVLEEGTEAGVCTEISTEGMSLDMCTPLIADACGEVLVEYEGVSMALCVRVMHTGSGSDGVRFIYESDEQRDEVVRLVTLIARFHGGCSRRLHQ